MCGMNEMKWLVWEKKKQRQEKRSGLSGRAFEAPGRNSNANAMKYSSRGSDASPLPRLSLLFWFFAKLFSLAREGKGGALGPRGGSKGRAGGVSPKIV